MENINGYVFDKSDFHNSPNGAWVRATKGSSVYFLKKFQNPKYPREGCSADVFKKKSQECEEWLKSKKELIRALNEIGNGTGNIVSPRDVFRDKNTYYQATLWIEDKTKSLNEVKEYRDDDKIMILKTFAGALKKVHKVDIIHGDLKPDNILIGTSPTGLPVAKIIDFDDSYFSKRALSPELTVVTDAYQSPELAAYKLGHAEYREKLTCANDVFAAGIIFHEFWCAEFPDFEGKKEGHFLFESIAAGKGFTLSKKLPEWLSNLITAMLEAQPDKRPTMEMVHQAISNRSFDSIVTHGVKESSSLNVSKLNALLAKVPLDLSAYTEESAAKVRKGCAVAEKVKLGSSQENVNKCIMYLYAAIKTLQRKNPTEPAPTHPVESIPAVPHITPVRPAGPFTIEPVSPLPTGCLSIEIITDNKVKVHTASGTVTIPRPVAIARGWVVEKK